MNVISSLQRRLQELTPTILNHCDRMLTISRGVLIFCLLTLVALSCESNHSRLSSIDFLKTVYLQGSLPMHNLILLHWFANNIFIDNNDVVQLFFDRNLDFGAHLYRNYESLLAPVPSGYQYYTIGNLNSLNENTCSRARVFPPYVFDPRVIDYENMGRNRDRIIVQAQTGSHRIGQMYLTQHFRRQDNQGSRYDPDHTFELSIPLFRQLRRFSFGNNNLQSLQQLRDQFNQNINNAEINEIINIWGINQAPLGLLFLIVIPQRANLAGVCRATPWVKDLAADITDDWQNCELQQMQLDVKTGDNGTAKIVWKNVPQNQLNDGAAVVLFKNQMDQTASSTYMHIKSSEGSYDTSVPLNKGLQVRLHEVHSYYIGMREEISRGKEFESPDAVPITGYAQLQLSVKNGKACFELYVKIGCNEWKTDFSHSWVGLYKSDEADTKDYMSWQWQWAIKFNQLVNYNEYETFEYCTGTTIAPGLQARFMIESYNEQTRTPVWP